ncbi:hypothetical protein SprV_0100201100 [Sparganum proliferum]
MNLRITPAHSDQHLLPFPDTSEGHLDVLSVATLAAVRLCPHPEARPAGRAVDSGGPGCRRVDRPSSRHLQSEDPPTASQKASSNELAQRLASLAFAAAAQMQAVDTFTCRDSTHPRITKIDDEVARQIFKASQDFGGLQNTV